MGLCRSFFCGRATSDIELKYTASDNPMAVAIFDIAVDTGFGEKKKSNFFHLKAFSKTAESMSKYVLKGTKIIVQCQPQQERWKNKDGKTVSREVHYVQEWEFAESKSSQSNNFEPSAKQATAQHQQSFTPEPEAPKTHVNNHPWMSIPDGLSDELPFV